MNNSHLLNWAFSTVLLMALLLLLEAGARFAGIAPGDVSPGWANFKQVDSLIVYDDLQVNGQGILVANAAHGEVYGLPVNSEGFHSPEFADTDTARPTAMLIGDSFTWGMNASEADSSFANILRKESGWNVHNLGIPAADPVQYALIAEQYIPRLRPDIVIVCFYTGNDIMLQDREAAPFREFYYFTNAGAILTEIDGIHFPDAQSAYDHLTKDRYVLTGNRNAAEWLVSRSAVLSRLYSVRFRWEEKVRWERQLDDLSITLRHLMRVRDAAMKNSTEIRMVLIPQRKEADMERARFEGRYGQLFHYPELKGHIHWPETGKFLFIDAPDGHLNDRGHRVYADFIVQMLGER